MIQESPPPVAVLRGFLLGTLAPDEAERVSSWVSANASADAHLRDLCAQDTLTNALSATGEIEVVSPVVERIVQQVVKARAETEPALNGTALGGYRIERELGRGGMGVVYLASDDVLGRKAAVKVLRPERAAAADARERFLREGRAVAAVKSDHVVTVYQVGEAADGTPYLAMEFLNGSTLDDWLRTRAVAVADVVWVARDLLSGLAVVHDKGFVHRDIKPANLWVDGDMGRVKVLDFGLTRGAEAGPPLTQPNMIVGTPAYMSPEQANGQQTDARSDLFSVGVVLHRMLSGQSPFQRDNHLHTMLAVINEEPAALPGVPPQLSLFLARLLAKNPTHRPRDARAALEELRALEKFAVPRKPRKPWLIGAAAAVLLGAVVLGIVITIVIRNKGGKTVVEATIQTSGSNKSEKDAASGKPPPQPDKRVRVKEEQTGGYSDTDFTPCRYFPVVHKGTTGKAVQKTPNGNLTQVELDPPHNRTVWIHTDSLEMIEE